MMRVEQPRILKHALNWTQHRVEQPAMSADLCNEVALQMLLQERKSLSQTRRLWLPTAQAPWVGLSDCV